MSPPTHSTSQTDILGQEHGVQQINLAKIQRQLEKRHLVICTLLSVCACLFLIALSLLVSLVVVTRKQQTADSGDVSGIDSLIKSAKILENLSPSSWINSVNNEPKMNKVASKVLNLLTFRLPREIKPVHYDLFLAPDLKTNAFSGKVRIQIKVEEAIPYIALHANKLNVTSTALLKVDANGAAHKVNLLQTFPYEKYEYFVIEPEKSLVAGDYEIKMEFDGRLDKRIVGFYSSTYLDTRRNETRTIATSKFEPTYARQAFPSFDEPQMKAKFSISLAKPNDDEYLALSNMNEIGSEVVGDRTIVRFAESVPMSTYLTVFIVADFLHKEVMVDTKGIGEPFKLRCFSTPPQVEKLGFAVNTAKDIIEYYIQYFGIPYPLPKLDMAAIPDFVSGAMETWGLVTYRETNLLFDENVSSTANKQRVATVLAHELAHMWFGNLVTMKWWNDLWLNEGFASYIEYKGMQAALSDWNMMDQFVLDDLHGVMNLDATTASHAIVQTVETPDQITEIFDTITYSKGASVIRMLEDFIGPKNFQLSVTNYLKKHQYDNAVTDDLLTEIDALHLDLNVKEIMSTWTEQMGYPVLSVTRIASNEFQVEQKRFLTDSNNDPSKPESKFGYKWDVPVTYFTDTDKNVTRTWLKRDQKSITIKVAPETAWLKLNKDQIGYYRVNYDEEMWEKLTNALVKDLNVMSTVDRAHLLNDAFSLADATQLPFSVPLNLTQFLANERSFVPWKVAATRLKSIKSLLYYTELYPQFRKYGEKLVDAAVGGLSWNVDHTQYQENHFRTTILSLACSFGHQQALTNVTAMFQKWLENPSKKPHPDLRGTVYYYGMQTVGNEQIWNQVWEIFVQEQDAQEKVKLMSALSAIQVPWILNRYLLYCYDEKNVRGQDYFSCVQQIANNRIGENIVWDYVRMKWPELVERFGINERYLGRMIPSITSRFSTETKLQEMKDFFAKYPEAGAGEAARKQALEKVSNNIKWLANNMDGIEKWLK
ncbi:glutamyl aminopeptidase-like [Culicoides brevitarsis]|uniref:glutamyl aminopeptidase-like n=1 Tax=Culicoides brevitarsis TaxID=469753 RepID=UPI00307CC4A2